MIKTIKYITIFTLLILGFTSCTTTKDFNTDKYKQEQSRTEKVEIEKSKVNALVIELKRWLGTKYKYGGTTKSGVDCSALVMQAYKNACNIRIPRSSREQHRYCKSITQKELTTGDLVFFATGKSKSTVTHVGVYIGNGEIIHASSSRGVIVSKLSEKYYTNTYHSSGRINELAADYKITPEETEKIKNIDFDAVDEIIESEIDAILEGLE